MSESTERSEGRDARSTTTVFAIQVTNDSGLGGRLPSASIFDDGQWKGVARKATTVVGAGGTAATSALQVPAASVSIGNTPSTSASGGAPASSITVPSHLSASASSFMKARISMWEKTAAAASASNITPVRTSVSSASPGNSPALKRVAAKPDTKTHTPIVITRTGLRGSNAMPLSPNASSAAPTTPGSGGGAFTFSPARTGSAAPPAAPQSPNHLYVLHADIRRLACDAWLLPSGSNIDPPFYW
jgi:hypothetical protein